MKTSRKQQQSAWLEFADLPQPARLQPIRARLDDWGKVEGLDDDELLTPNEAEVHALRALWEPVLLNVRKRHMRQVPPGEPWKQGLR